MATIGIVVYQKWSFLRRLDLWETYCYEARSSELFEDKVLHSLSSKP